MATLIDYLLENDAWFFKNIDFDKAVLFCIANKMQMVVLNQGSVIPKKGAI